MRSFDLEEAKVELSNLRNGQRKANIEAREYGVKINNLDKKIKQHLRKPKPKKRAVICLHEKGDYVVYGIRGFIVENLQMFHHDDVDLTLKQCKAEYGLGKVIRGERVQWMGWTLVKSFKK